MEGLKKSFLVRGNNIVGSGGPAGKSAYEIAVNNGFIGTEDEWLESLKGSDGVSPTATVEKVGKVATITITDKNGTTTAIIKDGEGSEGGETNIIESISVNGTPISVDENKNVDITVPSTDGLATETYVDDKVADYTKTVDLADVAITGSYNDLVDKPTIPSLDGYAKTSEIPTTVAELTDSTDYAKKTDIPTTLPANGGNSDTVNNHSVETDVPVDAKFTDTIYDDTEVKGSIDELNSNLDGLEFGDIAGGKNLANINDFKLLTTNPSRYGYEWLSMKGGTYTFNITNGKNILYIGYKHNGEFVNPNSVVNNSKVQTITISDGDDIVIWYENGVTENTVTKLQLEVGSVATEYEPYIPSVKMLATENAQQSTEAMDLKMLGWNVPKECPVQNYVDSDGVFHQKVGRVDLGTLDWSYSSEYKRFSTSGITDYKKKESSTNTWVADAFLKGYSTTSGNNTASDSYNKSIGFNGTSNMFFVKNTSYTDAASFKNAMQGKYLYYELATEISMNVDGNEAVTHLKNDLSNIENSLNGISFSVVDGILTITYDDGEE